MVPPPDTIDRAYEVMKRSFIDTLTDNAADAFVAGEVRASRQLGIGLNFSLINSRAVSLTRAYREDLVRFGGSQINGEFVPWLNDIIKAKREQVGAIVDGAIREGTPLTKVSDALDEVFTQQEHRASLVAYQETRRLYNEGTLSRFNHENIQQGIFHHMDPQENPRPEHQAMDSKVVDINDPDIRAMLDDYNCHCWIEPIIVGRTPLPGFGDEE